MNISLADSSVVIGDTLLPVDDNSVPMWDLLYAHQIGSVPVTALLDNDIEQDDEIAPSRT